VRGQGDLSDLGKEEGGLVAGEGPELPETRWETWPLRRTAGRRGGPGLRRGHPGFA
jgi:hypothetical protein